MYEAHVIQLALGLAAKAKGIARVTETRVADNYADGLARAAEASGPDNLVVLIDLADNRIMAVIGSPGPRATALLAGVGYETNPGTAWVGVTMVNDSVRRFLKAGFESLDPDTVMKHRPDPAYVADYAHIAPDEHKVWLWSDDRVLLCKHPSSDHARDRWRRIASEWGLEWSQ